ncbi:DUF6022 family protein [Shimazuella sp. AN120528]|uniref:DUF6022 family protein n=1 Tax=Shimazuella soli TaxID=1892854 RepID=UPI001F0CDF84|nr:DUF6022 family protein [Shimazuella soli]MCH5585003.1 DUF6022 family protein [Shimazuella soli]
MKNLKQFIEKENNINSITRYAKQYVKETWETVLHENQQELQQIFEKYGDRAYGVYVQKFMEPIQNELLDTGFSVKKGFQMGDSIENWGPPEERERCIWYVIKQNDGTPLGTLVLQLYHSHTRFHLPKTPHIFSLEVTERDEIMEVLSLAPTRIHDWTSEGYQDASEGEIQQWEYSVDISLGDYLKPFRGQIYGSAVDYALASWGRNGWELVNIVPHQDRIIAYFKRPLNKKISS